MASYKAYYPSENIEKIKNSENLSEASKQRYLNYLKKNKPVNSKLYFNDTMSVYFVEEQMLIDNQKINPTYTRAGGNNKYTYLNNSFFYQFNYQNKKIWVKHKNREWEITKEKKNINGYNCVLAKTYNKGNKLTKAWFTSDISFQYGPYKFYGLPGLIVKLESPIIVFDLLSLKETNEEEVFSIYLKEYISEKEKKKIINKQFDNFSN